MDTKAIVANVASIAALAGTVARQATGIASAVTVAKAGLDLVKDIREAFDLDDGDVATLETSREALEAAVNAHADKTLASLG